MSLFSQHVMKAITPMGYLDTGEMQPSVSMVVSQTPTALSQSIVAYFVHFPLDVHSLQPNKGTIVAVAGSLVLLVPKPFTLQLRFLARNVSADLGTRGHRLFKKN